ncbi:MAG: shikimate dehydrogenase [Alistipes sp.]
MNEYGLIGCPLHHSFSADYFNEKFAREGITDTTYTLFELQNIADLPPLLRLHPEMRGLNVTSPYKQTVMPYLDDCSVEAHRVGAVNCVRCQNGKLIGHNTDVIGFRNALGLFLGDTMPEQALVLGTGGASLAVQYVLAEYGITYTLISRDQGKGNYTYDQLPCEMIANNKLIINTTPLGMYPQIEEAPRLPYAFVSPEHYLFDLIYNPALTQFLDYGQQRGAHICNGQAMFIAQAEASWRIWNEAE